MNLQILKLDYFPPFFLQKGFGFHMIYLCLSNIIIEHNSQILVNNSPNADLLNWSKLSVKKPLKAKRRRDLHVQETNNYINKEITCWETRTASVKT